MKESGIASGREKPFFLLVGVRNRSICVPKDSFLFALVSKHKKLILKVEGEGELNVQRSRSLKQQSSRSPGAVLMVNLDRSQGSTGQ